MSFTIISISDAKDLLFQKSVQVVDIRSEENYRASHIETASNIGEHNIDSFVASADLESPVIVYCYSGMMSQNAAAYFSEQGFNEVYSLEGGFTAWSAT